MDSKHAAIRQAQALTEIGERLSAIEQLLTTPVVEGTAGLVEGPDLARMLEQVIIKLDRLATLVTPAALAETVRTELVKTQVQHGTGKR